MRMQLVSRGWRSGQNLFFPTGLNPEIASGQPDRTVHSARLYNYLHEEQGKFQ